MQSFSEMNSSIETPKIMQLGAIPKSGKRRRVHFGPSVTIEYESVQTEELKSNLWWNRDEFDFIMSKALHTAAEARKRFILTEGLEQAVGFAKRMAGVIDDHEDLYECLERMQDEGRGLRLWCQYGHSRRGIEKHTSRSYHETRRSDTRKLIKQVVLLSRNGVSPEEIRASSERTTRPYTLMARMFGIADAKAATSELIGVEKLPRIQKTEVNVSQRPTMSLQSKTVLTRVN